MFRLFTNPMVASGTSLFLQGVGCYSLRNYLYNESSEINSASVSEATEKTNPDIPAASSKIDTSSNASASINIDKNSPQTESYCSSHL